MTETFVEQPGLVKQKTDLFLKKYENKINFKEKVTDFDRMGIIDPLDPNETRVRIAMEALNFADRPSNIAFVQ